MTREGAIVAVAVCLLAWGFTPSQAEECFEIEHSLEASLPGVSLEKTSTQKSVDGVSDLIEYDFAVANDQKAHLSLQCSTKFTPYPVLMDDYDVELPAEGHFALLAKAASIVTHAPTASLRRSIQACYDRAHASEEHNYKFEQAGITFDCDAWPNGAANFTIAKHQPAP